MYEHSYSKKWRLSTFVDELYKRPDVVYSPAPNGGKNHLNYSTFLDNFALGGDSTRQKSLNFLYGYGGFKLKHILDITFYFCRVSVSVAVAVHTHRYLGSNT